ncbi:phosphotransferase [Actinoplanes sp. LDG1-06]|uniref:Phosphotransferase n=1 Tax=Paractinoplanes ovalisporus TaxID=2810368 RepID=A0ABS2AD71_9ACTN|nr:phosphotransferase [Actinoplanes ovalisporus]MBM2617763.1 phosphotransferase [Actinoplanes ovalisporus]
MSGLGEPFAFGREADVYALGDGTVLRRYREGGDTAHEAAVMRHVSGLGYPVPRVFAADGADLVLERLDGPTMATDLLAGNMTLRDGAGVLADLLRRLHELPPLAGGGGTVVHLDLHPENVVMTGRGPVVIDWHNSGDGDADLDTAFTALILAQIATGAIEHPIRDGVGAMLDVFLELAPGEPLRALDEAVAIRSRQVTMSVGEVAMLPLAAARVRGVE